MEELSRENFEKLKEYIYRKSGIALEYDKHYDKIKKKLEGRCSVLGCDDFRKYFFKLRFEDKSNIEFEELMTLVTVNETYFFRENQQFEALVQNILPEIHLKKYKGEAIRILSAPCSTGEEPYSIVLHLLEDNKVVNERDIEIVGIDIDKNVIQKAMTGEYSERSLHELNDKLKSKYFDKKSLSYKIKSDYNGVVDFKVANVFDKANIQALGKFDVIFSRNMLIYFDDASRKEVAMTFYGMLNHGGYIMLGHAEYMSRIVSVFTPVKMGETMAYRK